MNDFLFHRIKLFTHFLFLVCTLKEFKFISIFLQSTRYSCVNKIKKIYGGFAGFVDCSDTTTMDRNNVNQR